MANNLLIITGASQGIGQATAQLFLQQGWQVINLSRKPCPLPGVQNFTVDLTQPEWHQACQDELIAQASQAQQTCLVHNAAYYCQDSIATIAESELRKAFEVAVVAPAILNKMLLPVLAKGSAIIYLGSTLSEKAVAGAASYVTTKHAVAGLMKATCQDLVGQGIHTCCVCPGFTDTTMLRSHLSRDPALLNAVQASNAAQRLIAPQEIAEVIWFAAHRPVINGAVLHANLGQVER